MSQRNIDRVIAFFIENGILKVGILPTVDSVTIEWINRNLVNVVSLIFDKPMSREDADELAMDWPFNCTDDEYENDVFIIDLARFLSEAIAYPVRSVAEFRTKSTDSVVHITPLLPLETEV